MNQEDLRKWCVEMVVALHRDNPSIDILVEAKKIFDWVRQTNG